MRKKTQHIIQVRCGNNNNHSDDDGNHWKKPIHSDATRFDATHTWNARIKYIRSTSDTVLGNARPRRRRRGQSEADNEKNGAILYRVDSRQRIWNVVCIWRTHDNDMCTQTPAKYGWSGQVLATAAITYGQAASRFPSVCIHNAVASVRFIIMNSISSEHTPYMCSVEHTHAIYPYGLRVAEK